MGRRLRMVMTGVIAMAALSALALVALVAVLSPQQVGAEADSRPSVLCDATGIEGCEPVKKFDVKKLYKNSPEIDQNHPSRIDFYGQMFQKFPEGTDTMMQKVFKLKKRLKELARMQYAFEKKLDKPVQTTMSILPGEPGRMGARGPRGPAGPPGFMGRTGPQGRSGHPGPEGVPGDEGNRGRQGPPGEIGDRGRQGEDGDRGPEGVRGAPGVEGPPGPRGPDGYEGQPGPQGLDGQQGNRGPRGVSPRGPAGSPGVNGAQGVEGPKGAQGARGDPGPAGFPGVRGDPGVPGYQGKPGKDAKRYPPSQCGVQDIQKKNVCCGDGVVDWHNFYDQGAYIDINTKGCKFSDDDVMYFTNIFGNGEQWVETGAQAIYSSSKDGYRVYVRGTTSVMRSWYMNALQQRIKWCGVGVSTGPKQAGVCCSVGKPSDLNDWGGALYTDVSTKACQFGGDPIYLTSLSGKTVSPVQCWVRMPTGCGRPLSQTTTPLEWFVDGATNEASCKARKNDYDNHCMKRDAQVEFTAKGGISNNWDVIGSGATYPGIGPLKKWFRVWLAGARQTSWFANKAKAEVYDWRLNWCGFGTVFPNGDMQLATNRISKEEYPCDGVRVVDGENVVSNKAELCCGIEDNVWQQDLGGVVSKKIDTSHCCFTKKEKKLPVQCWVRMPTGCGRPLSQTTTPLEWFVDGATNEASCKARKNDYDYHCMKRDAQVEFTAKGIIPVTWLTTLRGAGSHWTLSGISAPINPTNVGFEIKLVPTAGSIDVSSSRSNDLRVQWCGVGERDVNNCAAK